MNNANDRRTAAIKQYTNERIDSSWNNNDDDDDINNVEFNDNGDDDDDDDDRSGRPLP